jgi:hypothetical protein
MPHAPSTSFTLRMAPSLYTEMLEQLKGVMWLKAKVTGKQEAI